MKIARIGLYLIISASVIVGALCGHGMVIWYFSLILSGALGLFSAYYLYRIKWEYGNDLFLKTLTKANQEGIEIKVTDAMCPHCGKNIFEGRK
jgi:hypothetical protein